MRISKQTKKTTLAQQGRYLLICLLSMLLLFLAGSVLILNRTQRQVYEQLEEISKLYTDELDNRFFRISRNLFSTVMDSSNPDSAFWKYMDLMEKDQYEEYVITQLRRNYASAAWDFGTDYNVFLYTQKDDSLYQLSISSDGLYAVDPYLQEALKRRIKSLSQQTYAVKKKWTVMCQGDDVYMLKVAQSQGVGLGCYVNLKTILEPFSELSLGKSGYVSLVDQNGKSIGTLTEKGIVTDSSKFDTGNYTFRQELSQAPFEIRIKISWTGVLNLMTGSVFALLGVAFLMVIAGSVLLFHLETKILKPVGMFTENLQKYDNGDLTYQMSEGNLVELEQIDDRRSSCRTAGFRDFISFQAVYFSGVGKEHQIVMCIHHQQFFDVVVFDGLHTLDALATAVLSLEIVNTHTFNITKFCHGDHNIFTRDQIFCRNIIHIKSNGSSSLITILICDFHDLCFDHAKQKIFVCQNGSQLLDLCHQSFILCFDLLSFQTGQCTQTHIYDRLCLCIGKFKTCHQCFFCKCCCSGCTDNADDFINMIQCDQQTF